MTRGPQTLAEALASGAAATMPLDALALLLDGVTPAKLAAVPLNREEPNMIAIKPGVLLENLTPQMVLGHTIVAAVFLSFYPATCRVTSGSDGTHMRGSLHPKGNALDYGTNHLLSEQRSKVAAACKEALGENFDVVLESDHLHVEYDPKASSVAIA